MKYESIAIENFRSFENINVDLMNQNVIFGMNDVGKSNFIHALRFLFDRNVRKNGFSETDFFQNDIESHILIRICISVEDFENSEHSRFIVSKMGGARTSNNLDNIFIELRGEYDKEEEIGLISLYWGNDLGNLCEIPNRNLFFEIDRIFNITYIDPLINLETLFKKYRKDIFKMNKLNQSDMEISQEIKDLTKNINKKISTMQVISDFERDLTEEYHSLKKEKLDVTIKSEMAISGYFNDLIPYIKKEDDSNLYPTSGDGRRKILSYSLLNYAVKSFNTEKITIFLIEEPENNLHRSLQLALSKKLFSMDAYNYFFLTTHSSDLLYDMDNASLIRIYSEDKINCSSTIYSVSETYKTLKHQLNKQLGTAIFSNKVLLIEGPSEKVLFEKVLSEVSPYYELEGVFLLEINGVGFRSYKRTLEELNIKVYTKTDNDIKRKKKSNHEFELIGFNRALSLSSYIDKVFENVNININKDDPKSVVEDEKLQLKKHLFDEESELVEQLNSEGIYLSKVDLEYDLQETLGNRLSELTDNEFPVKHLQEAKLKNMANLMIKLSNEDCTIIYNSELFKVLKEITSIEYS